MYVLCACVCVCLCRYMCASLKYTEKLEKSEKLEKIIQRMIGV